MTKPNPFKIRKPASVTDVMHSPEAEGASENFSKERLIGMTFNMPESWHRDFKMSAVAEGVTMHELLGRCYDAWKRERG